MALSMRRIFSVLIVMAMMVAMMVASAMPAFADKGGRGHTSFSDNGGDCVTEACQFRTTETGKRTEGEEWAGRYSSTHTLDYSSDPWVGEEEISTQGGGKGIGGGNCTDTYDFVSGEVTSDHHGKRCG